MDKALKQRLVGASVLVALAVVVLPMLLGGRPEDGQESRAIAVPPRPSELSFETRRFPVGGQDPEQASTVQDPVPITAEEQQARVADTPPEDPPETGIRQEQSPPDRAMPEVQPEPAPATETRVAQTAAPAEASSDGRYLVQVGSFSTTSNANALAARLRADGMPVLMDTIESSVGTLHRVRVGPYASVAEADAASTQIQDRTPDVAPRVIDLRPDDLAPVTEPSDPLVRWVVQAGSFGDESNSSTLVSRLREAGFAAYSVVETDAAGTRYKVRIGPEIDRQSAVRIAADLRDREGIDGIVMSVD